MVKRVYIFPYLNLNLLTTLSMQCDTDTAPST